MNRSSWLWKQRVVLSLPARWRGFGWLDRYFFSPIGIGPRLLSTRTPTIRAIDRHSKRQLNTMSQSVKCWFWRRHSINNAAITSGIVFFLLIGSSLVFSAFWSRDLKNTQIQAILEILGMLAQVTGATVGILLAVVTFGVALRAQSEQGTWSLLPFVARRYHMFLIIGGSVGVAAANGVMPALYPAVDGRSLQWMLYTNVILLPLMLVLSLRLVCAVIEDAGTSTLDNTIPVIQAAMRDAALRDERHAHLCAAYDRALNLHGLIYNSMGWYTGWSKPDDSRMEIKLDRQGVVTDVDLCRLERLGVVIGLLGQHIMCEITVRPGDQLTENACLILRIRRPTDDKPLKSAKILDTTENIPIEISVHTRQQIERLWSSLFIARRLPS